jgi:hypothetical protein
LCLTSLDGRQASIFILPSIEPHHLVLMVVNRRHHPVTKALNLRRFAEELITFLDTLLPLNAAQTF